MIRFRFPDGPHGCRPIRSSYISWGGAVAWHKILGNQSVRFDLQNSHRNSKLETEVATCRSSNRERDASFLRTCVIPRRCYTWSTRSNRTRSTWEVGGRDHLSRALAEVGPQELEGIAAS